MHTHTHTRMPQNRTQSSNTVENLLYSLQITVPSETQRTNLICGYVLKEKKEKINSKTQRTQYLRKQSFHGCKTRQEDKKSHVRSSKVCLSLLKCQCPPITKSLPWLIKVNVTESYGHHLIH